MSLAVEDELYLRNFLNDIDGGLLPMTTVSGSASLDFGSIAYGDVVALTIALTGAVAGATVAVGPPAALEAGLLLTALIISTNLVEVRCHNMSPTFAAVNPAPGTYKVTVFIP